MLVRKHGGGGAAGSSDILKWESDIEMNVTEEGCEVWTGLIWLRRGASLGFL